MPAVSQRQRNFFGAVVGGDLPLPPGMTMTQARDFARPPRMAEGGQVPLPPNTRRPLPRFAEGGQVGFVKKYYPYARAWSRQTGIPPEVFLAIGASESNWGAAGSIFGIKGASPSGQSRQYQTWEMVDGKPVTTTDTFAVYDDPNEGFAHFTGLISSGRYAPAWQQFQKDGNWQNLLRGINQAGYATDPQWANKIVSLTNTVQQVAADSGAAQQAPATATSNPAGATAASNTTTSTTDPVLSGLFTEAQQHLARLQAERDTLLNTPNRTPAQHERLIQLQTLDIPGALSEVVKLYSTVKPGAGESPSTRINAQTAGWNALQGALQSNINAQASILASVFTADVQKQNLIKDIVSGSFNQELAAWQAKLDKGQADLNGAVAYLQAQSLQQTAEAARAIKAMEWAGEVNKNDWALAERLLPPGTHYQPMFGPNDPINQMLQSRGLNPMVVAANPVDPAKLDLRNTLREMPALQTAAGWNAPAYDVANVRAKADAITNLPGFSGTPLSLESFRAAGGELPDTPDYSKLQAFLKTNLTDLQNTRPWWEQSATTTLQNPDGQQPAGTGSRPAPPSQPAIGPGDLEQVDAQARAMTAASAPRSGSFLSTNAQAAPGLTRAYNPRTNTWGLVYPRDAVWDDERGGYIYNPGYQTGPADTWEIDPQTGGLRRRSA